MKKDKLERLGLIVGIAVRQAGWTNWTTEQKVSFENKLDLLPTEDLEIIHERFLGFESAHATREVKS